MKRSFRISFWTRVLFLLPISISVSLSSLLPVCHADARDELLVDALVNNLTHPSQHIRVEALQALEELGNPTAIPARIEPLRFDMLFRPEFDIVS
jgi:hypothetical protein